VHQPSQLRRSYHDPCRSSRPPGPGVLMAVLVAISYARRRILKGRTSQTRHATLDGYAEASHQRCASRNAAPIIQPPMSFFFGEQFHESLYAEKARFGPKAATRPVKNSREGDLSFYTRPDGGPWPSLRSAPGGAADLRSGLLRRACPLRSPSPSGSSLLSTPSLPSPPIPPKLSDSCRQS
jgi:hypothetical protein